MEGKTVLSIAHRLSTLTSMDRLLIIDDGKIIEEGSHNSLLEKHGVYSKLWNRQIQGFI
jgi:ABC-type multidrug transport system fused ATPase/permease subunit